MKGKIITLICLLNLTSFLTLHAQWARTYGTGDDEHAYSIQQANDDKKDEFVLAAFFVGSF